VVISSQPGDFSSWRTSHPSLTTKTARGISIKGSFTGKSFPNGDQGSLIHRIGYGTEGLEKIGSDTS